MHHIVISVPRMEESRQDSLDVENAITIHYDSDVLQRMEYNLWMVMHVQKTSSFHPQV